MIEVDEILEIADIYYDPNLYRNTNLFSDVALPAVNEVNFDGVEISDSNGNHLDKFFIDYTNAQQDGKETLQILTLIAYIEELLSTPASTNFQFHIFFRELTSLNLLIYMVPKWGIEPQTFALRMRCSTN